MKHYRILTRTVAFIIIVVFSCENAVWASPELLQPISAFQKEGKNNRGALPQMKGAYRKEIEKARTPIREMREQLCMSSEDMAGALPRRLNIGSVKLCEIEKGRIRPDDELLAEIYKLWKERIGGVLAERRKELGLSQRALAKRLGISDAYLCLIEQGKQTPNKRVIDIEAIYRMWRGKVGNIRKIMEYLHMDKNAIAKALANKMRVSITQLGRIEKREITIGNYLAIAIYNLWKDRIGKVLRRKREQLGMSQEHMVKILRKRGFKIYYAYLIKIEKGREISSFELAEAIHNYWKENIGRILREKLGQIDIMHTALAKTLPRKFHIRAAGLSKIAEGKVTLSDELMNDEFAERILEFWKKNIGKVIRKKREQLGLSRDEMVSLLPGILKIDKELLRNVELGRNIPTDELIEAIHKIWRKNIAKVFRMKRIQMDMDRRTASRELRKMNLGYGPTQLSKIEFSELALSSEKLSNLYDGIYEMWKRNVGRVLKKKRTQLELTQEEMVEKLPEEMRIPPINLGRIENGKMLPSDRLAMQIHEIWGLNIGGVLKKKREQLGMSTEEMAKMLKIEILQFEKYEEGSLKPGDDLIAAVYRYWRENIGESLKARREALGLNQKFWLLQLQEGMDISQSYLSKVENRRDIPSDDLINQIRLLYLSVKEIKEGKETDALFDDERRDIAGSLAEHGGINPKLAGWIRDNKVVDYYYEEGRWVPYRVRYIEGIDPESEDYYDEQGNPVDKGERMTDDRYQMSDEEQRRLNETLTPSPLPLSPLGRGMGEGERGRGEGPVRLRVVLGETAVGWMGDVEHSSLVHVGERTSTIWFGEGLFRNLLSRDEDTLRELVFRHEKEHLIGNHGVDKGDEYQHLVEEVHRRCTQIKPEWIKVKTVSTKPQGDREIQFILNNYGSLSIVHEAIYKGKVYMAKYMGGEIFEPEEEERRYLIPQAEILCYLNSLDVQGICKAEHFLELENGRKVILFEIFPDGQTLEERIEREGAIPVREAIDIMLEVSHIVRRLHEAGVIHWDIKPRNIWITDRGEVILFDFDLAHRTEEEFIQRGLYKIGTYYCESGKRYRWRLGGAYRSGREAFPHISDEIYSLGITLLLMMGAQKMGMSEILEIPSVYVDNQLWRLKDKTGVPLELLFVLHNALSRGECGYISIDDFICDLQNCRRGLDETERIPPDFYDEPTGILISA